MYGKIISNFRRERLRLKQFELAEKMGVNVSTLNVVEKDFRKPSMNFLEKLSKSTNVHISEILGHEFNKQKPTK